MKFSLIANLKNQLMLYRNNCLENICIYFI